MKPGDAFDPSWSSETPGASSGAEAGMPGLPGLIVQAPLSAEQREILTPEALGFLLALGQRFSPRVRELLAQETAELAS